MATANDIEQMFDRLWPFIRSITGDGVRKTHRELSEVIPLEQLEIPSGKTVFDWTVPAEWVVNEAYLITPDGEKICNVNKNNLHLVNYSVPYEGEMTLEELDDHLYTLENQPEAIPYVTSYYKPRWGFCLSQEQRDRLPEGTYKVVVDTELKEDGSMTISECVLEGTTDNEILFSTNTCHPSLAHNELSGPLVTAFLYEALASLSERYYTYRFVFLPETIGAIAYLNERGTHLQNQLSAGFTITCIGDDGTLRYKRARNPDALPNRITGFALQQEDVEHEILEFTPSEGSDERQYCSPGFNLPVGSFMRTPYQKYSEYHTSLDNRDFISFEKMADTVSILKEVCVYLEKNRTYQNLHPYGEPQLGKRDLYPTLGTLEEEQLDEYMDTLLRFLNYSDGRHDLLDIAREGNLNFKYLSEIATRCLDKELVEVTG